VTAGFFHDRMEESFTNVNPGNIDSVEAQLLSLWRNRSRCCHQHARTCSCIEATRLPVVKGAAALAASHSCDDICFRESRHLFKSSFRSNHLLLLQCSGALLFCALMLSVLPAAVSPARFS